eukprot:1691883-Amphidinium_carterae.1
MVQQWEEERKLPMHWGGKGKSCAHHGWLQQLMHEAALGVGDVSAGIYLDICKAFEHIGHQCLWRNAQLYSFPKRVLAVACTCIYSGPRCLNWRQQIAIPICVQGTVIPGCALAVALMKLALHDVLVGALGVQVSAQVQQVQVVDDLSASCSGAPRHVISSLVAVGQHLLHGLHREGLPVNRGKCRVIGANERLRGAIARELGLQGADATEHLGHLAHFTQRRRTVCRRARLRKGAKRLHRLCRLRKAGVRVARIAKAGPLMTAMWGVATDGLTGAQLHRTRCQIVREVRKLPIRALDPALVQHGEVFRHWCQEVTVGSTPLWIIWASIGYAVHRLSTCRAPWSTCCGPAHLMLMVCVRLGWVMRSPICFVMRDGILLDVTERSTEFVLECVKLAT